MHHQTIIKKDDLWERFLFEFRTELKQKYSGADYQTFYAWLQTLQAKWQKQHLFILAPNDFVMEWLKSEDLLPIVYQKIKTLFPYPPIEFNLVKGSIEELQENIPPSPQKASGPSDILIIDQKKSRYESPLNENFTFDTFIRGKSNEFACAVAIHVVENLGKYNPLLLYGGVGLGKTHLMQAIGNALLDREEQLKIGYFHSERFVKNMIKAIQINSIEDFQKYYRSLDVLLADDVNFFEDKNRSQEEFFHTFNALYEDHKQIVLTCDRYPKEIRGLKERLRSRFGWGLTVAIDPPDLETRVAILMSKAEYAHVHLPSEAAFFIAKRIYSNVRELEGALKRVIASADFMGEPITLGLVKDILKDLIAIQDKIVTVENIQRVVAEYYRIKIADLLSKRRCRSVARPRQIAMALSKELTDRSFPEIGEAFGGRDHTTVLHAYRKIKSLREISADIQEDWNNLMRILTH